MLIIMQIRLVSSERVIAHELGQIIRDLRCVQVFGPFWQGSVARLPHHSTRYILYRRFHSFGLSAHRRPILHLAIQLREVTVRANEGLDELPADQKECIGLFL